MIAALPAGYTCSPSPVMGFGQSDANEVPAIDTANIIGLQLSKPTALTAPKLMGRGDVSIPQGTTRVAPRLETFDAKRTPAGFLTFCPYPGFDADRIDKYERTPSAIYQLVAHRDGAKETSATTSVATSAPDIGSGSSSTLVIGTESPEIPSGYTQSRHPILYPHKNP